MSEMRIAKGGNKMTHRLNKWMLVVDDPINCMVDLIMDFLEGDFSIRIVPWFL